MRKKFLLQVAGPHIDGWEDYDWFYNPSSSLHQLVEVYKVRGRDWIPKGYRYRIFNVEIQKCVMCELCQKDQSI